jgi:hypothetical protein
MDANETKNKFPKIWEYMCLYGVSFDVAKSRLETKQNVLSWNPNQNDSEEEEEHETDNQERISAILDQIETDLDSEQYIESDFNKVLSIQLKRKMEIFNKMNEFVERLYQQEVNRVDLLSKLIESTEKDRELTHKAYDDYLQMAREANAAIQDYNQKSIEMQKMYNARIDELNSRIR